MNIAANAPVAACDAVTETGCTGVLAHNNWTVAFSRLEWKAPDLTVPVACTSSPTFNGGLEAALTAMPPVESCTYNGAVSETTPRIVMAVGCEPETRRRPLMG